MSIDEVQQGVHKALGALPHDELLRARTLLDEAATALAEATAGSDDATLHETLAHYRRTSDELDRVLSVFAHVHATCNDYLTSIGAFPTDTAPPRPAPPSPSAPPPRPLRPHLDEHVFRGHIRYKQFTGYHSRPGGVDTGDITVGAPEARDAAGCYRAAGDRNHSDRIIAGMKQIIRQAHGAGLRVVGGTLTPFQGWSAYTPELEATRQAVNEWIRTSGAFDAVIDFDAAVRDPSNPHRLLPAYDSGDHLHPDDAGYRAMAAAIDLADLVGSDSPAEAPAA